MFGLRLDADRRLCGAHGLGRLAEEQAAAGMSLKPLQVLGAAGLFAVAAMVALRSLSAAIEIMCAAVIMAIL
jgi:hypothetical protein